MSDEQTRRRWINLGEIIALCALVVSAAGVWIAWKSSNQDKTARVVEQRQPIALTLHSKSEDNGRTLLISPVEPTHTLVALSLVIERTDPQELGGEGTLRADDVAQKISGKNLEKGTHAIPVAIDARYVEMGRERSLRASRYTLRYRVEGAGLLGGRSVRLLSLSKG